MADLTPQEHCARLERMYHGAACNEYFRPRISISPGRAEVSLEIRPDFLHSGRSAHGSVYFKLLDDAAFFAVASQVREVLMITVSLTTDFMRPVSGGRLTAIGGIIQAGRSITWAGSEILDQRGKLVARASGSFMRSKVPLDENSGYL